ncbi:restriction endonuclease PLD domain-containing protein [uncultured Streptococcus sp.]|uniref:restriction endonuclease PLD domain-containing protein n=1 Tax=uncultured Streptococcus sp. TaxID=83427 RepID=UPI0025968E18|nr:restriction endonuclease PLD domain-containing protein [uncultured Streptococcus sp.]
MLYISGLEDVIFSKHEILADEPDELIIISGFLGPAPVQRLSEFDNIKITVIGGMYRSGIDARLWDSLEKIDEKNSNLKLLFTTTEIHSKIYIWKRNGKILAALIGSANFSSNGLRTDYRESLADATRDTFSPLEEYYKFIIDNSVEKPHLRKDQEILDFQVTDTKIDEVAKSNLRYSIEIPLYDTKTNEVPPKSGLNWGLSAGHVALGDAYIRIPKEIIKENNQLFKPFDPDFMTPEGKRKRNSDPIELIWDDGVIMEASLEGVQFYNNEKYPKQLASYSSKKVFVDGEKISKKSILGRYLRNRLGIGINELITMETLSTYGRNTISLSLIGDGVYYAEFSVEK